MWGEGHDCRGPDDGGRMEMATTNTYFRRKRRTQSDTIIVEGDAQKWITYCAGDADFKR